MAGETAPDEARHVAPGYVVVVVAPRDRPCVAQIEVVVGPFPDLSACDEWIDGHRGTHPDERFLVTRVWAPSSSLANARAPDGDGPGPGDVI